MRIAFIGGGHMASSLIGGLLARGEDAGSIVVADPLPAQTERLTHKFGIATTHDNDVAARSADTIVLAVKPQDMAAVARSIAAVLGDQRRLVISIAAGIRISALSQWLGVDTPIVRSMPNHPALVGYGITALFAAPSVRPEERERTEAILGACGETVWLDAESQMDAVTAVSGSGPAYFFLLMEALEDAARAHGLPAVTARRLAVVTALGAAQMAVEGAEDPATLRAQVTSKGGTTEAALEVLESADLRGIFSAAVAAAARRSADLAGEAGGQ